MFFWQFVADTRSTVLGWAPPCSDVSKQLLLSHFPFSCFAENHHHHAKMDGTLSINPCARSCHSVPPDTSFSPPHPTPGSGRLTVIDRINTSCLRLPTVASEETGRRISLFQGTICSIPGPGMLQTIAKSSSLVGGHLVSLWQFNLWGLIVFSCNLVSVEGQPGSPECSQGIR